jgi:hypothetical protein
MDGLARRLRAFRGRKSDRGIVARYFPRHVRDRHEIAVADVVERCARCARRLAKAHPILHVWKLRAGSDAIAPLLTLCDGCDADLRPLAYLHVTRVFG